MTQKFRMGVMGEGLMELRHGFFGDVGSVIRAHRPSKLWIEGDWTGENLEPEDLEGIKELKVAATDYGFALLDKFSDLSAIEVLTKPKRKQAIIPRITDQVKSVSTVWFSDWTPILLTSASLRNIIVEGIPAGAVFHSLDESKLEGVKIVRAKIANLDVFSRILGLRRLEVVFCPHLSLIRTGFAALEELRIENAKALESVDFIESSRFLRELRLDSLSPALDFSACYDCSALKFLLVGGPERPLLDWVRALKMPAIETIAGWWDPSRLSQGDFYGIASSVGRQLVRFEPSGPGNRTKSLFVQLKK